MARKVNWAYKATTDLEALAEYIARDSAFYASALNFFDSSSVIAKYPLILG